MKDIMKQNFERIMQNIQDHLMKGKKYIPFRKTYTSRKIKCDKKGNFQDILHIEQKENYIYWIMLIQKDGSRSHVICVVNNLIIDSNLEQGLALSLDNLNICCHKSSYIGICSGYIFYLNEKLEKHKKIT